MRHTKTYWACAIASWTLLAAIFACIAFGSITVALILLALQVIVTIVGFEAA